MNTFYQPECILGDMDNIQRENGNVDPGDKPASMAASEGHGPNLNAALLRLSPPSVAMETSKATTAKAEAGSTVLVQPSPSPVPERLEEQRRSSPSHTSVSQASPSPPAQTPPTKVLMTGNRSDGNKHPVWTEEFSCTHHLLQKRLL